MKFRWLLSGLITVLALSFQSASAYQITNATFDPITQNLQLNLAYETCGLRPHSFTWMFDRCNQFADGGLAVRLEDPRDLSEPETCDQPKTIEQVITQNLSLVTCPARPFELSVFAGHSHATVTIK